MKRFHIKVYLAKNWAKAFGYSTKEQLYQFVDSCFY